MLVMIANVLYIQRYTISGQTYAARAISAEFLFSVSNFIRICKGEDNR